MLGEGCRDPPLPGFPNEANVSATEIPVSNWPLTLPFDLYSALNRIISALAFLAISGSSRRCGSEMVGFDIPHAVASTGPINHSERGRTGIGTLVGVSMGVTPLIRPNSNEVITPIGSHATGGRRYSF